MLMTSKRSVLMAASFQELPQFNVFGGIGFQPVENLENNDRLESLEAHSTLSHVNSQHINKVKLTIKNAYRFNEKNP
jgi:hypothetical protein